MKLIINLPAYNEEEKIGQTIQKISRQFSGIDEVLIQVVNDGRPTHIVNDIVFLFIYIINIFYFILIGSFGSFGSFVSFVSFGSFVSFCSATHTWKKHVTNFSHK